MGRRVYRIERSQFATDVAVVGEPGPSPSVAVLTVGSAKSIGLDPPHILLDPPKNKSPQRVPFIRAADRQIDRAIDHATDFIRKFSTQYYMRS